MLEIVAGLLRFAYDLEADRFVGEPAEAAAYVNVVYRGVRLDPMHYYPDRITARAELAAAELGGAVVGALPDDLDALDDLPPGAEVVY